jgi:hypothetical protein
LAYAAPENRTLKAARFTSRAGSRAAYKYSNVTDRERLRETFIDR